MYHLSLIYYVSPSDIESEKAVEGWTDRDEYVIGPSRDRCNSITRLRGENTGDETAEHRRISNLSFTLIVTEYNYVIPV